MELFDRETAERVWNRVQRREGLGEMNSPGSDPGALVLQAHGLAGLYLGLQRGMPGAAERLRRLYKSVRKTVACTRGLCCMQGTAPGLPPMEAGSGSAAERLRSCAHREQRLGAALALRASEGEFGPVWAQLSRQAGERCREVLELLGSLED